MNLTNTKPVIIGIDHGYQGGDNACCVLWDASV